MDIVSNLLSFKNEYIQNHLFLYHYRSYEFNIFDGEIKKYLLFCSTENKIELKNYKLNQKLGSNDIYYYIITITKFIKEPLKQIVNEYILFYKIDLEISYNEYNYYFCDSSDELIKISLLPINRTINLEKELYNAIKLNKFIKFNHKKIVKIQNERNTEKLIFTGIIISIFSIFIINQVFFNKK